MVTQIFKKFIAHNFKVYFVIVAALSPACVQRSGAWRRRGLCVGSKGTKVPFTTQMSERYAPLVPNPLLHVGHSIVPLYSNPKGRHEPP